MGVEREVGVSHPRSRATSPSHIYIQAAHLDGQDANGGEHDAGQQQVAGGAPAVARDGALPVRRLLGLLGLLPRRAHVLDADGGVVEQRAHLLGEAVVVARLLLWVGLGG